jgi:Holliday junction resolvase RusA-like endonuclease
MKFHLRMIPPTTTHQSKKIITIGKGPKQFSKLGDTKELSAALRSYEEMLRPFVPEAPVEGPTRLLLQFVWPYLKSMPKRDRESGRLIPKLTTPDCSNIAKTLEDRLVVMRILATDQQVYDITSRKFYGPENLVGVHVEVMRG